MTTPPADLARLRAEVRRLANELSLERDRADFWAAHLDAPAEQRAEADRERALESLRTAVGLRGEVADLRALVQHLWEYGGRLDRGLGVLERERPELATMLVGIVTPPDAKGEAA